MRVGFTGTREGMTTTQKRALTEWLAAHVAEIDEFHHGACLGADEDAVTLAVTASVNPYGIHAHPSDLEQTGSIGAYILSGRHHPPKPPLERNKDILSAAELLIAAPKGPEELRSGTWSTVRCARKRGVPVLILWPNGEVTEEKRKSRQSPLAV